MSRPSFQRMTQIARRSGRTAARLAHLGTTDQKNKKHPKEWYTKDFSPNGVPKMIKKCFKT
eukprot:1782701-Amphidinium_carterae.1